MKKITTKKPEQEIKSIIYRFLDPREYEIFIFGSQANGQAERFSDYDIGISGKGHLSLKKLSLIREAFEESDLPFNVDIVDFSQVSSRFRKQALSRIIKL